MPRYDLGDQTAIVTGAARGIGRAIALRLAQEGASIAVVDLDGDGAAAVASEARGLGGEAFGATYDVTKREQVRLMVNAVVSRWGRVDLLVNNAGVLRVTPVLDVDDADWDLHMNVNARALLLCAQAVARQMIAQGQGGRIIAIISSAGKIPSTASIASYVASKHAAMGLVQQLGLELARHKILVNAVFPGIVDTEMLRDVHAGQAAVTGELYEAVRERALESIPLGRFELPQDVANMVAFLASSDASYSTGQAFDTGGGAFFW